MTRLARDKRRADELAAATQDAYSADRYGESWRAVALLLVRQGYSDEIIEAILRSKYTRWAADAWDEATAKRFKQYMLENPQLFTDESVAELIMGD